jgi:cytoskeletal protein CcmA (bactofilin family)
MFSKSRPAQGDDPVGLASQPARMATGARNTTFSIIGADVVITGNVSATVDLHVDGRIEGDLSCANLVQGAESIVKGAIIAESARLAGTVDGSITARDLTIQSSAKITGDVAYENLTIEQGSQVEGRFAHRRGAGTQQRAIPAAAASAPAQEVLAAAE